MGPRAKRNSSEARTETLVFRVTAEEKILIGKKLPKKENMNRFLREIVKTALGLQ